MVENEEFALRERLQSQGEQELSIQRPTSWGGSTTRSATTAMAGVSRFEMADEVLFGIENLDLIKIFIHIIFFNKNFLLLDNRQVARPCPTAHLLLPLPHPNAHGRSCVSTMERDCLQPFAVDKRVLQSVLRWNPSNLLG